MKKKIITLTSAFLLTLSVTFAQSSSPVPAEVVRELKQEFRNATNVQWKVTAQFYKATFNSDGTQLDAFFAPDGRMMGVSRFLTVDQLPLRLIKDVKEKSATHSIATLFEMVNEHGTEYYITYRNEKEEKIFKSDGHTWVRYN